MGLGGLALMAVLREGEASNATMYTLVALAAVALGGTAFNGKRGSLIGTLFGAACMYLITNVLSAARVPQTKTLAPCSRKAWAIPLPMPLDPPTTRTRRPLKSRSSMVFLPSFQADRVHASQ